MVFTVFAGADLYNNKLNLELEFPSLPTLSELNATLQNTFSHEAVVLKLPSSPLQRFELRKVQVFNDTDGSWRDVVSSSQLFEFAQLYCFQVDPNYHESQQQLPPARRPSRPTRASSGLSPVSPRMAVPVHLGGSGGSPSRRDVSPNRQRQSIGSFSSPNTQQQPPPQLRTRSPPKPSSSSSPTNLSSSPAMRVVHTSSPSRNLLSTTTTMHAFPPRESATHQEKLRFVFDEMDTNKNRVIELEEFKAMLRGLNIEFSSTTVMELFRKADADRDNVLTINEFANFFSLYTTLLDSCYFRLRDILDGRQLQNELAAEKGNLDLAKERRQHASQMVSESVRLVEQQIEKLRLLDSEKERTNVKERDLRSYLHNGELDLEQGEKECYARQHESAAARDREASRKNQLADARSRTQHSEAQLNQQANELASAQDKVRQLQQLLVEAQQAAERQQQNFHQAQNEVSQARNAEEVNYSLLAEAQKETQFTQERLAASERELLLKKEKQKELHNSLADVQNELNKLLMRIENEERDTNACRDREAQNRALNSEAEVTVGQQEKCLLSKDQEIVEFTQRRAALEQQERPLIEQEVRLREQRDFLEEKEIQLRANVGLHFEQPRPALQTRLSPLRDGSYVSPSRHSLY